MSWKLSARGVPNSISSTGLLMNMVLFLQDGWIMGLYFCYGKFHRVETKIKKTRKRPRKNIKQQNACCQNFGREWCCQDLHTYTHCWVAQMLLISAFHYCPSKLVCKKNWISIFIQLLHIIRNNAFLLHCQNSKKPLTPKKFLHHLVCWLMMKCSATTQQSSVFRTPNHMYQT